MNLISVITLLGAAQGVILFFAIIGLKRGDREANRLAAIFILCISIALCGRWAYSVTPLTLVLVKILFIGDSVIFFYGPLLHLYFRKLFHVAPRRKVALWVHFVPLALFVLVVLPFMFMDREGFIQQSSRLQDLFSLLEFLAIVQNGFYVVINLSLVKEFESISYRNNSVVPQVSFYRILLGITLVGLMFWAVSFILQIIDPEGMHDYLGYHIVWIGLSTMVIGLGYYLLRFPETVSVPEPAEERSTRPAMIENADELAARIDKIMRERRPYLEPRLTLTSLSEISGINPHLLSRVINERFGRNFFEFVNSYRVEEFKKLASREKLREMTLFALALESGFNSKSTFNAAFKKLTNQTPREYHQSLPS